MQPTAKCSRDIRTAFMLLRMMHTHSLSRPAGQHNHGRAHRRQMECKGGWRRTCFRDTVRCGHGRLYPGSKGLFSVPTMLTGPGNGHCDPGDATSCVELAMLPLTFSCSQRPLPCRRRSAAQAISSKQLPRLRTYRTKFVFHTTM